MEVTRYAAPLWCALALASACKTADGARLADDDAERSRAAGASTAAGTSSDASGGGADPRDGGPPDASSGAQAPPDCPPSAEEFAPELCNGVDDDCDGVVDEQAASECETPFALAACLPSGSCAIAECQADYLDCNNRPDDGCETPSALAPCGCSMECPDDSGRDDTVAAPMKKKDAGVVHVPDDVVEMMDAGPPEPCEGEPPNDDPELCNQADDDCDGEIDEGDICDFVACYERMPSHRDAECDACVCNYCRTETLDCQLNDDSTVAKLCDDLVSCFVSEPCDDCWQLGLGPCAGEVNLASGGVDEYDATRVTRECVGSAASPCAAGTRYRDCVETNCSAECADP